MHKEDEFAAHAEQAERMAEQAKTAAEREAYLQIAKAWRDLIAESRRRRNRT